YGLEFEVCAFTNLYHDHIGGVEHPTMEHYRDCKKMLFDNYGAKSVIINSDSDISEYMIKDTCANNIVRTSATGNTDCDIYVQNSRKSKHKTIPGVRFDLYIKSDGGIKGKSDVFLPFPGLFNVENALEIIAICQALGIGASFIVKSLPNLSVAGRSEFLVLESKPKVLFVIDYAHNGASLEKLILAAREYTKGRIIVLFGSVGGRTYTRRGELGRVARELADITVITSDNPNFEDPMAIIGDIAKEFYNADKEVHKVADRRDAIRLAFEIANESDTVILAGKGHENYQLICGQRVEFSERHILHSLDKEAILLSEAIF
ncbi:MAG: UDP-N-acetylmuramoyl-L-alanyl-D-glutamate--2,6-diaminopimelate ligase, partial [Clostridia bacterium]|nr:UDP-N-acetylmuramoyl-L-alanyl-D-glutamate--2,6-diaminopimelate ligase [Clostridia bacterium]